MKKFWLTLWLTLMLACWCGVGYYGFGTCPAFGQYYDPRGLSCNPSDPYCYNEYHAAPYADPLSQLLYYIAPQGRDQYYAPPQYYEPPQHYERQQTKRERKDRERYERQQTNRERQDHQRQDREHQDRGQRY